MVIVLVYIPTSNVGGFLFPTTSQHLLFCEFLVITILSGIRFDVPPKSRSLECVTFFLTFSEINFKSKFVSGVQYLSQ